MPRAQFTFFGAFGKRTRMRGRHSPSSPCCFAKSVFARSIARIGQKFCCRAPSTLCWREDFCLQLSQQLPLRQERLLG
eukprot:849093-Pleurochrysis_carterae.AAC.1